MKTQDTLVRQLYVEKRPGFDVEARGLKDDLAAFLGVQYPALAKLVQVRILNAYQLSGAELDDGQFKKAVELVFSEPQSDRVFDELPEEDGTCFGVEYLPGQYDQRADSAEQCLELALGLRPKVRCAKYYILVPGALAPAELAAIKTYLINPVDSREVQRFGDTADAGEADKTPDDGTAGALSVPRVAGFGGLDEKGLSALAAEYGLAMSGKDLVCCRDYFASRSRDPTITELRVLDTYWSDHCRHTTFTTVLDPIEIADDVSEKDKLRKALECYENARRELYGDDAASRPRTLMDMATIGAKLLKKRGMVPDLDESEEINACTIKVTAEFERKHSAGTEYAGEARSETETGGPQTEPWLLLFKNETHNHPTEIEPFGGAATCLGGAIRDPLSGRAYVHQAMRISGGGDPRRALAETLPGKLPQIKIAREAAAGYSSYGNQIGLATGQVAELYHDGYLAKRLELGAVIGAVPASQVRRAAPEKGDVVLLIGGKTGRDGIGGATGSSKAHTGESVESAGAEVQKGNAVEERKLQRLFRRAEVSRLIKRCNDFGAGGVSVAVGELAPGLDINLDAVPKKYAGLDGTELAISESQERMAVVAAPEDAETLIREAAMENLDAVVIARVSAGENSSDEHSPKREEPRLRMSWRGTTIVDLSRNFLDSNGATRRSPALLCGAAGRYTAGRCGAERKERFGIAEKATDTNKAPRRGGEGKPEVSPKGETSPFQLLEALEAELGSLRSGSRRGLQERFDGSVGAGSVLFPWGGRTQGTPECGMAALLPALPGKECLTASVMSFGFDPGHGDPCEGAKGAVKEALAKFACLGGDPFGARLSMQEYFERMETPESWGKPAAALLGALEAQLALGVPAIGGKDSMSGSYRDPAHGIDIAVPPTLAVFAAGTTPAAAVRSGTLSGEPGHLVLLLYPAIAADGKVAADGGAATDEWTRFKANMNAVAELTRRGLVKSAYPVGAGGTAAALALAAFGNMTGLDVRAEALAAVNETGYPDAVLLELAGGTVPDMPAGAAWIQAAETIAEPVFRIGGVEKPLAELRKVYESVLESVYPQTSEEPGAAAGALYARAFFTGTVKQAGTDKAAVDRAAGKAGAAGRAGKSTARPLVLVPVFPGTNGEWDMEQAFLRAGARVRQLVFRNRNAEDIAGSTNELAAAIAEAQIVAFSGGFSAGDEPDGSGKFIANVLRSPALADAIRDLLEQRDGLMLGICNGFQALVKLGLVPYGRYTEAAGGMPTLTFNRIGRHVSRMVRTTVMSKLSPWLALEEPGAVHILPVSHGEGRLVINETEGKALFATGQVSCCYAGEDGLPAVSEPDNPNGSDFAIEGLSSPDGRVLGKMGHSERSGRLVHVNIPGNKNQRIFEAGVAYFG